MNKSPQERQCTLTKTTQSCDNSLAHVPICLPNRTLPHPTYTNRATNAHLIPLSMHKIMHSHTESCNRRTLKLRKFTEHTHEQHWHKTQHWIMRQTHIEVVKIQQTQDTTLNHATNSHWSRENRPWNQKHEKLCRNWWNITNHTTTHHTTRLHMPWDHKPLVVCRQRTIMRPPLDSSKKPSHTHGV